MAEKFETINFPSEEEKPERRQWIQYEEIGELEEPIQKILEQLRDKIENGEYGVIVGDDASGRVPALIFDKVIKGAYQENNHEQPQTLFFAGSRVTHGSLGKGEKFEKKKFAANFLKRGLLGKKLKGKALIVTDTIETGGSLESIAGGLKEAGIEFDIATICMLSDRTQEEFPAVKEELERKLGGEVYYGYAGSEVPQIFAKHNLSGVYKDPRKPFAEPSPILKERKWGVAENRFLKPAHIEAREDVKVLAEDLLEWYKSQRK